MSLTREAIERTEEELFSGCTKILLDHIMLVVQGPDYRFLEELRAKVGFNDHQMNLMYRPWQQGTSLMAANLFDMMVAPYRGLMEARNVTILRKNTSVLQLRLNVFMNWTLKLDFNSRDFRLSFLQNSNEPYHHLQFIDWQVALYFFVKLVLSFSGIMPTNQLDQRLLTVFDSWACDQQRSLFPGKILPARLYHPDKQLQQPDLPKLTAIPPRLFPPPSGSSGLQPLEVTQGEINAA